MLRKSFCNRRSIAGCRWVITPFGKPARCSRNSGNPLSSAHLPEQTSVAVSLRGRLRLPSPCRAELVRRGPGLLAEKAGEVGRIGEGEIVGDLVDRLAGEHELALGFGEHALADQVAGGDAGCAPDVIVEAVDRHCELVGVEGELPLLVEVLFDEL